jgi:3-oxoacyl-[acyl-carrier-protein] synthase II
MPSADQANVANWDSFMTRLGRGRVFVTGIGLSTPLAATREESWQRLQRGDRALDWLASSDDRFLPNSAGGAFRLPPDLADRLVELDRRDLIPLLIEPANALAVATAMEAVEHSGIDWASVDKTRVGCVVGTSKGGVHSMHALARASNETSGQGSTKSNVVVDWNLIAPNAPALIVSSLLDCQGACIAPVTACATGMSALLRAAMLIQTGECDVVVAGSTDASLTPSVLASFRRLGVLANGFSNRDGKATETRIQKSCDEPIKGLADSRTRTADPRYAVAPFDKDRSGFLVGEGGALLVMESEDHVRQRSGSPMAEWLGSGMASDAAGLTQLESDPASLTWLIRNLIDRTQTVPDYIGLHGTATKINDRCESLAVQDALGDRVDSVVCSSIKGSIGHLLGAAGSVELAVAVLALRDQVAPPNVNLVEPTHECTLNLVRDIAQPKSIQTAMKLSLGFGGHLIAAMIGRP